MNQILILYAMTENEIIYNNVHLLKTTINNFQVQRSASHFHKQKINS